jgi:hypothetical protein
VALTLARWIRRVADSPNIRENLQSSAFSPLICRRLPALFDVLRTSRGT